MKRNLIFSVVLVFLILLVAFSSFMTGFTMNRSKKSYDFENIISIPKNEIPKYRFLEPELSDYICELCSNMELDSDLIVALLMTENPTFNKDAVHKNQNGTIDCGLFQLNDKYLWTTFREKYWFDNLELDPFNWKHNTYIALHHFKYLIDKFKITDDSIMAYNSGEGAVMSGNIPDSTYTYLLKVKTNLWLIQNQKDTEILSE